MTKKLVVKVRSDEDIANPAEFDHNWRVVSFNSRHYNYEDPEKYLTLRGTKDGPFDGRYVDAKDIGLRSKLRAGTAFILSYFEHSSCKWSLRGEGPQCRWDNTEVAGLLLWDHAPGDMGAKTYEDRAKDARGFLENYTDWCNGWGMGYEILIVEEDEDGEETETGDLDSCWGFYNSDSEYMVNEIVGNIKHYEKKHGTIKVEVASGRDILEVGGLETAIENRNKEAVKNGTTN